MIDASVIERLAQANVLVVGDVLLDRYVEGRVSRISPEAPVPVLRHAGERSVIGAAGNVAANVIVLGGQATLCSIVGEDSAADELTALCAGLPHLRARLVRDRSRPTTVKTRFLSGWHQLIRVDAEETHAMAPAIAEAVLAEAFAALRQARVAVLSDYAKGVLSAETIARLVGAARNAGVPVLVDPKKSDASLFAGARLLTPNLEELAAFTGIKADSDEAAEAACRRVLANVAIDGILVTRGAAGMTLVERGAKPLHIRAETHRVFDVTGAGDTVIATLAAALAVGEPLAAAVRLANTAAGIAVTKPGTATVHPSELRHALGAAKAASVAELGEAVDRVTLWKSQNLKVGLTNGCFDLLHRGHLYSLEQAARRVDRLVVAVNSDASTARLKGPGRPVQDLATRSAVLAALRFVDLVVPFDEDTPEQLIHALSPDILFKGSDYAESDVVGGDHVKANGGRVELLPLLAGHSTTSTVKRLTESRRG
jgi:D-beta-D-heptose 7-phosphate kinase/D-beta-D-heptose 1-phosphate adenosyltransferase